MKVSEENGSNVRVMYMKDLVDFWNDVAAKQWFRQNGIQLAFLIISNSSVT